MKLAEWKLAMGRGGATLLRSRMAKAKLLAHPQLLEWANRNAKSGRSPLLSRRFELLERWALEARLEYSGGVASKRARLEEKLHRRSIRIQGRKVTPGEVLECLLKREDRSRRQEAYYAEDRFFRSVENEVRSLVKERNDLARSLGYKGFAEAYLALAGLTPEGLSDLINDLPLARMRAFLKARKDRFLEKTGLGSWFPWDYYFLHTLETEDKNRGFPTKGMVSEIRAAIRKWGIHSGATGFRIDRAANPFVGQEFAIDPPRDVRVVVDPKQGQLYYSILFHEMGHAIHSRSVSGESVLLRNHEFAPSFNDLCEGVGGLFEEISASRGWLRTRPHLAKTDLEMARARSVERSAYRVAELAGIVKCELSLYRDPERDIERDYHEWKTRVLGYDDHDPRSWVDPFYLDTPLYNRCYLLASLFVPQVMSAVLKDVGGDVWPNDGIGPWLTDNFLRHGAAVDWLPLVKRATGASLSSRAFSQELRRAS